MARGAEMCAEDAAMPGGAGQRSGTCAVCTSQSVGSGQAAQDTSLASEQPRPGCLPAYKPTGCTLTSYNARTQEKSALHEHVWLARTGQDLRLGPYCCWLCTVTFFAAQGFTSLSCILQVVSIFVLHGAGRGVWAHGASWPGLEIDTMAAGHA